MHLSTFFGLVGLLLGVMGLVAQRAGDPRSAKDFVAVGVISMAVAVMLAIGSLR